MILERLNDVGKVLIIGSGKGGVGKSTLTALLGLRLKNLGMRVGILDTDLHGASIPFLLGGSTNANVETVKGGFKPAELWGIKVMSLRMFVGDRPVPLRGERKSEVLKYMLSLTVWGPLDYLLIDLPPGMSDELLTLMKYVKGQHTVVTLPTKTSMDVTLRYIKFLSNLNCSISAVVVNNLVNATTDNDLIVRGLRELNPSGRYLVMPYLQGVEEHLSRGMLPEEAVNIIDEIIKY